MRHMKKGRIHPAWGVLVACTLFQGATTGIMYNCLGLFYASICNELGFRMGDLSLYNTIRQLVTAFSLPYMILLLKKKDMHRILLIATAVCSLCFGMMGAFHHLIEFYISGAVMGLFGGIVFATPLTIVINNWFHSKKSLALGIAFAASGVAGALLNPVCSWIILQVGWRMAAWIMAGFSMLITGPMILFVIRRNPEEKGCLPYGAGEKTDFGVLRKKEHTMSEQNLAVQEVQSDSQVELARKKKQNAVIILVCSMVISGVASLITQYNSHLVTMGQSIGLSLMGASAVASCAMVGNVISKVLLGILGDKKGYRITLYVGLIISALSFCFFLASPYWEYGIYCGGLLYGTTMAIATIVPSLMAASIFDPDVYEEKYARMMIASYLASAIGFSAIGYSYDVFGSYLPSMYLVLVLCALAAVAASIVGRKTENRD